MTKTPEEWADELAKEIDSKEQEILGKERSVAIHREVISEKMPILWEEMMKEFQRHCQAYNERFKPERTLALFRDRTGFSIKPDALPEIIRVDYDPQAKRILVRTKRSDYLFEPKVDMKESGKITLCTPYGKFLTPAAIAQDALRDSIGA